MIDHYNDNKIYDTKTFLKSFDEKIFEYLGIEQFHNFPLIIFKNEPPYWIGYYNNKENVIVLNVNFSKSDLTYLYMNKDLFPDINHHLFVYVHELQHFKQCQTGKLKVRENTYIWENRDVYSRNEVKHLLEFNKTEYNNLPWEAEANTVAHSFCDMVKC